MVILRQETLRFIKNKLFVAFSIMVLLGSTSCKKNSTKSDARDTKYYFRATFNGVKKNFSYDAKFQGDGNNDKWEHIVFGGNENKTTDPAILPPGFDIELWMVGGNITMGTYDFNSNRRFISRYGIQKDKKTILYNTEYDGVKDFVITITELSKDGIKGTFKGTIKAYYNDEKIRAYTITDGAFYLPFDETVNSSY